MIFTLATLLAFLAAILLLLGFIWYKPAWAVFFLLLGESLVYLLGLDVEGVQLVVNFYIPDLVAFLLVVTAAIVLLRFRKKFPRDAWPPILLLSLVVLDFFRGIGTYGLKPAGSSIRVMVGFAIPAIVVMLLSPALRLDTRRLARWLAWAGPFVAVFALLRWAGVMYTPTASLLGGLRQVDRVLTAEYASVVAMGFIAAVYLPLMERRSAWWWGIASFLGGVTLALQHRSVWVATLVALLWLLGRSLRVSPVRVYVVGVIAGLALFMVMFLTPGLLDSVIKLIMVNVQEVQHSDSTWAWRVQGYQEAMERLLGNDMEDMLIGPPAGWAAVTDSSVASTYIHSQYVGTLAYYGFFGLSTLLLWLGLVAKRIGWTSRSLRRRHPSQQAGIVLLEALFLLEAVYMIAYPGGSMHGAALGLIWIAATQSLLPANAMRFRYAGYVAYRGSRPPVIANPSPLRR